MKVSAAPSQILMLQPDGLYVPNAFGVPSPDAGNLIGLRPNGIYAQSVWGGWNVVASAVTHDVTLPIGGTDVSLNADLILGPLPYPMAFLAWATFGDMQVIRLGGSAPAGVVEGVLSFESGWTTGGGAYHNQANTVVPGTDFGNPGFTVPPISRFASAAGGATVEVKAYHVYHSTTAGQLSRIVHPQITMFVLALITP